MMNKQKTAMKSLLEMDAEYRRRFFKPFDKVERPINRAQHFILLALWENGPMNMSRLAQLSAVSCQQLTSLFDKLVKLDFAKRYLDENCRRSIIGEITDKGREYIISDRENTLERLLPALDTLTEEEMERVIAASSEIKEILQNKVDKNWNICCKKD